MRSKKRFIAAAAVGLGVLAGCVSFQVDDHSYQFNEATGSLSMRLLLLNAVRASKDYPLQFTKISAYQGTGTTSASVSATLPLRIPGDGTMTPRVDWKDGISQLHLIDLNTAEAQDALRKTIPYQQYINYVLYGGSKSFTAPFVLLVEHIVLSKKLHSLMTDAVWDSCKTYFGPDAERLGLSRIAENRFACAKLRELERDCPDIFSNGYYPPGGGLVLKNDMTSECKHKAFLAGSLQFVIIGATPWIVPKKKEESPPQKASGNTFNIYVAGQKKDKSAKEELYFNVFDRVFVSRCLAHRFCTRKNGVARLNDRTLTLLLRSPERMVRYLGEVIAAQNYGTERFTPLVIDPERQEVYTLLTVKRGVPLPGMAAVSIVDPDGETFHIPRRNLDLAKTDLSLEIFSIVADVLNGAVSKTAYPPVTSLTVRAD